MNYKDKYNKLVEAIKVLQETNPSDEGIQNWVHDNVPELAESEDERIRKVLIGWFNSYKEEGTCGSETFNGIPTDSIIAWLEKQKDVSSIERVFRPIAGCDIADAATQAIEQQQLGYKIVLAFNGAYIRVEEKTTDDIVNEYYSWLEKQKGKLNIFDVPKTSIEDAVEVTSRMRYINDDMKPIADFIIGYAHWDLHKDEWNQPTLTVPLFRVLDALIQRGKPYGCTKIKKQDEQKPADVEQKFHEGDTIVSNQDGKVYTVGTDYYVTGDNICLHDVDGNHKWTNKDDLDRNYHLWTIADAKDGDVLAVENRPFIYNGKVNPLSIGGYCGICTDDLLKFYEERPGYGSKGWTMFDDDIHPATREQRVLLFRKMKEAGYVWDADKKEPKKIETNTQDADKVVRRLYNEACQKTLKYM